MKLKASGRKIRISLFIVLLVAVLFSANWELGKSYIMTPQGTEYKGAVGFFFDYYQFLSWIRGGANGRLLISSRYIPSAQQAVLLHPLFPFLGFISQPLNLAPEIVYHLARNVFLIFFVFTIYRFASFYYRDKKYSWWAFLLIVFASAFPHVSFANQKPELSAIIPFWKTFYTWEKFAIPAHHLLANALFLMTLMIVVKMTEEKNLTAGRYLTLACLVIILFLVNPASATFVSVMIGIWGIVYLSRYSLIYFRGGIINWKQVIKIILIVLVLAGALLPGALYYNRIFHFGNPWKYYYQGEKIGRYLVTYSQYLLSLGPLFFTSLLSFVYLKRFGNKEILMAVWGGFPVFLFPYVGRQLPVAMSRLFALNLYIPSAILTVFFLKNISGKTVLTKTFRTGIILFLIFSLAGGLVFSTTDVFGFVGGNYYNVYLPDNLIRAIDYMDKSGIGKKTVVAGENISNLIPAYTDFHVVNGRRDAYPDYTQMLEQVNDVYLRRINDTQLIRRLRDWNVKYILFGIDHVGYDQFIEKGEISGMVPVFSSGNITVGEFR